MLLIKLNKNIAELEKDVKNYGDFAKKIDLTKCTDYRVCGTEINIYDGLQMVYSCSYIEYYDEKYITDAFSNNGLIYTYDYDLIF